MNVESTCNVNVFIEYLCLCHLCFCVSDFLLKVVTSEWLLTITFHLVLFLILCNGEYSQSWTHWCAKKTQNLPVRKFLLISSVIFQFCKHSFKLQHWQSICAQWEASISFFLVYCGCTQFSTLCRNASHHVSVQHGLKQELFKLKD